MNENTPILQLFQSKADYIIDKHSNAIPNKFAFFFIRDFNKRLKEVDNELNFEASNLFHQYKDVDGVEMIDLLEGLSTYSNEALLRFKQTKRSNVVFSSLKTFFSF
jgi:hypothetical protein